MALEGGLDHVAEFVRDRANCSRRAAISASHCNRRWLISAQRAHDCVLADTMMQEAYSSAAKRQARPGGRESLPAVAPAAVDPPRRLLPWRAHTAASQPLDRQGPLRPP